jgi:hypothetical protein
MKDAVGLYSAVQKVVADLVGRKGNAELGERAMRLVHLARREIAHSDGFYEIFLSGLAISTICALIGERLNGWWTWWRSIG